MKKSNILSILITLVLGFILYYLSLPALNLQSISFYVFVGILIIIYFITTSIFDNGIVLIARNKAKFSFNKLIPVYFLGGMVVLILLVNFICSPLFNANKYKNRIYIVETKDFSSDIAEVDFNKIPLIDRDSSIKLGDRKMGEMSEWVSQFYVSSLYTQINYNDSLIRVTPIEYGNFFKWLNNRKDGIKGYIAVDSVNGSASLNVLDKGIKYADSAYFNDNLDRVLRFKYPTRVFGDKSFELDDDGNPYWVVSTLKYHGIGLKPDIKSVIILNPITKESNEYKVEDVPSWVDHVYYADLIIDQVNDWGNYKNGFFNSIIGQKNVVNTTDGYNYLAYGDDVFLYTGITSVSSDESNLGFILTNLRTKETNFYSAAGAEEYSAMESAKGLVQEKDYYSTFPLLINLNGSPTYLLSLKDNAGLVKMYAFVDVSDYQKVTTSDASLGVIEASKKYLREYQKEDVDKELVDADILIKDIKEVNIDGNTYYYIIDNDNKKYSVSIKVNRDLLPFISVGDKLSISYLENSDSEVLVISSVIKK